MPTKGFFTQCVAVLLREPVTLDTIEPLLNGFKIVKRNEVFEHWEFSGPAFTLEYRPKANGYVSLDIVDRPWPDKMGDVKEEPNLFGAWAMGHFGPFAFPGSLERAGQHAHTWEPGRQIAAEHQAFIRIRVSYVFGTP